MHHQYEDNAVSSTSPISKGRAPMAFCSALISSTGPMIWDEPVSTIAWQPALQRLNWLPTSTLWSRLEREWAGQRQHECYSLCFSICCHVTMMLWVFPAVKIV